MGAKQGKAVAELTAEQAEDYFKQSEVYNYSGCIDIKRLQRDLGIDSVQYASYQVHLQKNNSKILKNLQSYSEFKKAARSVSVPDESKRSFIIQLFDLKPASCSTKYAVALKLAQQIKMDEVNQSKAGRAFVVSSLENGLDLIRKEKTFRKYLAYDFLNERGLDEVELIISAILASNDDSGEIHCISMLVQIAGLLLLYLSPAEVFCVVSDLLRSSKSLLQSEDMKNAIRWHVPLTEEDKNRMHQAFCYSYLMTTLRKKRSLSDHMRGVGFELRDYARVAFDSLTGEFLPLYIASEFLMMYLVEGVKIVFRYAYGVLKVHKQFIKTVCMDKESLIDLLSAEARTKTNAEVIHKVAMAYPLKKGRYDLIAAGNITLDPSLGEEMQRKLTQDHMAEQSQIMTYEEIAQLWEKLPITMQSRQPKLLYKSSTDGLNMIPSYFEKVKPFESETKSCLIFLKSVQDDDEAYGLFFDDIIRQHMKGYQGQFENFLFTSVRTHFHVYKPTSVNPSDFKSAERLFEVGPSKQLLRENAKELVHCPHIFLERRQFASSFLAGSSSIDGKHSSIPRIGKKNTLGQSIMTSASSAMQNRSLEPAQGAGSSFNVSGDKAQKLSTKGSSSFESGISSGKSMNGVGAGIDTGLEMCLRVNGINKLVNNIEIFIL